MQRLESYTRKASQSGSTSGKFKENQSFKDAFWKATLKETPPWETDESNLKDGIHKNLGEGFSKEEVISKYKELGYTSGDIQETFDYFNIK